MCELTLDAIDASFNKMFTTADKQENNVQREYNIYKEHAQSLGWTDKTFDEWLNS